MRLKNIKNIEPYRLLRQIVEAFADTRFNFIISVVAEKKSELCIDRIRLKSAKDYCGNHPSACQRPHTGPDKRMKYLEGADWVEFNDRLNDVLDAQGVSATVGQIVVIRKGLERCICYRHNHAGRPGVNDDWKRNGLYANYCFKDAPRSEFAEGTPGIHEQIGYAVKG